MKKTDYLEDEHEKQEQELYFFVVVYFRRNHTVNNIRCDKYSFKLGGRKTI